MDWRKNIMCRKQEIVQLFETYYKYQEEDIKPYKWIGVNILAEKFISKDVTWQDLFFNKGNQVMVSLCWSIEREP